VNIGLIGGTGKEGRGLAARWARAGHRIVIGSRDPAKGDNAAAAACDVVVLCVPYAAHADTVREHTAALAGKVVIDLVVPMKGGCAAIEAQTLVPDARVVATLHHVSSVHLSDVEHVIAGDVLVAGDDAGAKEMVIGLIAELGMRGLDAGPLANAGALEAMTPVLIYMNKKYGKKGLGIRVAGID
jgi:NADPH-dependent F420 reductase